MEPVSNADRDELAVSTALHPLLRLGLRGAGYVAAFAVLAIALVWISDQITDSSTPVVAVLPVTSPPELSDYAAEFDRQLMTYLMGLDRVSVLSPSAIESRPANPFPFFAFEFGARWLIEGELQKRISGPSVIITIADARTGIVELQVTESVQSVDDAKSDTAASSFERLENFITSELAR
jgi:hypothetical protein